jgi:chromosomal replication initiation ATPase DnaA
MAYALLDEVCERRGVVRYDVMRKCNERRVVDARNEVAYLLRQADPLLWTYPKIGRWLGGKHHTTIIHGVRQHELKKAA